MARYDVHDGGRNRGLVIDCQADTLSHLNTRLVVPLQLPSIAPLPARKLNPRFDINGVEHIMVTQFAAAVQTRGMGPVVASLGGDHNRVLDAIDMLLCGY